MEKITIKTMAKDGSNVSKLFIMSDIHIGNVGFNERAFLETLDRIAIEQPTHVIINGDMIDGISRQDSKRFDPQSIHRDFDRLENIDDIIRMECNKFIEYMLPIKALGIELIILEGNHETAVEKYYSWSPYRYICEQLDAIRGNQCAFINIECGLNEYKIYAQHGTGGGGTTEGYHLNKVAKVARTIDCDVYTIGHIHRMGVTRSDQITFSGCKKKWITTSGCYLDTFTTDGRMYFSNAATSLSHIGYLLVELSSDEFDCKVRAEYL